MKPRSIEAYEASKRISSYDAEMEVMHPNRAKMVAVALRIVPFDAKAPLTAIDLGVGTGYFTERFLDRFPASTVYAIDGSEEMLGIARERLKAYGGSVEYRLGDFKTLDGLTTGLRDVDVVLSSYALHHLDRTEKETTMRDALALLKDGGWFINADLIVAETHEVEERIQVLRARGIVERAAGKDERFRDVESTRRFLRELEEAEGDQPITLREDLDVLGGAGFRNVATWWQEYREAVTAGRK
jgi:ubiquinone/menaquinone biosynthesis C-methylase UbiE